MFFKKIRDILSFSHIPDLRQQKIEDEFNNGKIVLPTGLIDYENYDEFKSKTSHLSNIQKKLELIENDKK